METAVGKHPFHFVLPSGTLHPGEGCCGSPPGQRVSASLAHWDHLRTFQSYSSGSATCPESSLIGMGGAVHGSLQGWFSTPAKVGSLYDSVVDLEAPDIFGLRLPRWPVFSLSLFPGWKVMERSRKGDVWSCVDARAWAFLRGAWLCGQARNPAQTVVTG